MHKYDIYSDDSGLQAEEASSPQMEDHFRLLLMAPRWYHCIIFVPPRKLIYVVIIGKAILHSAGCQDERSIAFPREMRRISLNIL